MPEFETTQVMAESDVWTQVLEALKQSEGEAIPIQTLSIDAHQPEFRQTLRRMECLGWIRIDNDMLSAGPKFPLSDTSDEACVLPNVQRV